MAPVLNDDGVTLRRASPEDLDQIAEIQRVAPEAAQWKPKDYLAYQSWIALCGARVAGFLVARSLSDRQSEILNLAVHPQFRRRGVGGRLVQQFQVLHPGEIFLEVRESNLAARKFYQKLGFEETGRRDQYYEQPPECAIVMKFHSC